MRLEQAETLPDHSLLQKLGYVRMIRTEWFPAIGFALSVLYLHNIVTPRNLILCLVIGLGYAAGFLINDYYDREEDKHDSEKAKRNLFTQNSVNPILLLFLLITGLSVIIYTALLFSYKGVVSAMGSIFILWAYSAEPFRLKSKPGLDILTHSVFVSFYPYYIVLYLNNVTPEISDYFIMSFALLFSMGSQLVNQIRDFEVDRMFIENFTIKFGIQTSKTILQISSIMSLSLATTFIFIQHTPLFIEIIYIFILPVLISRAVSTNQQIIAWSTKLSAFLIVGFVIFSVIGTIV